MISPSEATEMVTSGHRSFFSIWDHKKPSQLCHRPSCRPIDIQSALLSDLTGRMARKRDLPIAFQPPFISRSLVMNCCGRSQVPGVLYPIDLAMSATNALQL